MFARKYWQPIYTILETRALRRLEELQGFTY